LSHNRAWVPSAEFFVDRAHKEKARLSMSWIEQRALPNSFTRTSNMILAEIKGGEPILEEKIAQDFASVAAGA
jgi:hypothetical protein